MTKAQILDDLERLVLRIANELPAEKATPSPVRDAEWAYVKGIASAEIMRLVDRIKAGTA